MKDVDIPHESLYREREREKSRDFLQNLSFSTFLLTFLRIPQDKKIKKTAKLAIFQDT